MVVADGFRPKLHGIESAGLRALISEVQCNLGVECGERKSI